jgi:hypothetical protein
LSNKEGKNYIFVVGITSAGEEEIFITTPDNLTTLQKEYKKLTAWNAKKKGFEIPKGSV